MLTVWVDQIDTMYNNKKGAIICGQVGLALSEELG